MTRGQLGRSLLPNLLQKEILARIAQGRYPPGGKMPPERVLAEELGVSRLTLRQALANLGRMGVLQARHGSGNYVGRRLPRVALAEELRGEIVGLGPDALAEIVVARLALECVTVELAATNRTRAQITELRAILETMQRSRDDMRRFLEADMRFHQIVAAASGNRILTKLMTTIAEQQRFSMLFTAYRAGEESLTLRDHEAILKAIETRDPSGAVRSMRRHVGRMTGRYPPRRVRRA